MIWSMSTSIFKMVVATMFWTLGLVLRFAFNAFAVWFSSWKAFSMVFVPTLISLPDQKNGSLPFMFSVL